MTGTTAPRLRAAIASEWTKLCSVRSTYVSLLVALVVAVAGGAFSAHGRANEWATMTAAQRAQFDPVNLSYDGLAIAQLAFGVLGVLVIGSEYATGLIRSTFIATPRRSIVLAAKATVLGLCTLVVGEIFSLLTFLVAQVMLDQRHLGVGLTDPHVVRAVVAAGLYLSALALVGLGLGAIMRHGAAAITVVFSLVFIAPLLAPVLADWTTVPEEWTLWAAGNSLISTLPTAANEPTTGVAAVICLSYVVVSLGTAFVLLNRRDA